MTKHGKRPTAAEFRAAAFEPGLEQLKAMLDAHPDLVHDEVFGEETLLHFAAVESRAEAVRLLATRGADVNKLTKFGGTPLIDAVAVADAETVRMLIDAGADVRAVGGVLGTVLHRVSGPDVAMKVDLLMAAGADITATDNLGRLPLHAQVGAECLGAVRALLRHGADPNARTCYGEMPLHGINHCKRADVAAALVAAGADPTATDDGDESVLDAAIRSDQPEIVTWMLDQSGLPALSEDELIACINVAKQWGRHRAAAVLSERLNGK